MSDQHLSDTPFSSLDLPTALQRGVQDAGFRLCTPIQAETLPLGLQGIDVAGQAQTGTGKTAAFLLATMAQLLRRGPAHSAKKPNQPAALIVAPTRELAVQIHKDARALGKHTGLKCGVVYGGAGYTSQRAEVGAGVDILIGTPGRLIDYYKQRVFDLRAIQVVVLDEADRMFDLGFIKDIRFLLRRMPKPSKRLGMLFSATLSFRVTELAYEHMNNPQLVTIETDSLTANKVTEVAYYTANDEKISLLIGLLKSMDAARTMVFANTKRTAEEVRAHLESNGFKAGLLSGDVPQAKRLHLLEQFQQNAISILVTTDVAARGLHIAEVSHVINFDLPQDREDYVHRIGRTARAGASGDAISFVCEQYAFSLPDIEEYVGHKIAAESVDPQLLAEVTPAVARKNTRHTKSRPRKRSQQKKSAQGKTDAVRKPRRRTTRSKSERPKGEE